MTLRPVYPPTKQDRPTTPRQHAKWNEAVREALPHLEAAVDALSKAGLVLHDVVITQTMRDSLDFASPADFRAKLDRGETNGLDGLEITLGVPRNNDPGATVTLAIINPGGKRRDREPAQYFVAIKEKKL